MAFQNTVVKHKVGKEIIPVYQDSLLACFEAEPMPHFQQKVLQVVENGLLQVVFRYQSTVVQSQKLQRNGRVNNVGCNCMACRCTKADKVSLFWDNPLRS